MKRRFLSFALLIIVVASTYATTAEVAHYVNPFIGTGAIKSSLSGNNYPGATVPFGMVQLSPDTRDVPDWDCAAGYNYNDSIVYGFSHTRLSGTGASDFIDILMFPSIDGRNHSTFSHRNESAKAGSYQVQLIDENINAELTATAHAGIHRYTFPKQASQSQIMLDLEHSANKGSWNRRIIQSQIKVVSPTAIEGYRIITGWAKLRKIYFHIEFSHPIESFSIVDGERRYLNESIVNGTSLKANLYFKDLKNTPLISKVAISPVSIENAKLNMESEAKGWNFDNYVLSARSMWERELSKIQVKGTNLQKEIFYTALYHTMIQPNVMSDVNGDYIGTDYVTRKLPKGETHYSTFSLWDTFRAAHPLYSILVPELNADFVKSMIRQYDNYGYLPIWQLWGQDNYCMIGNHSIPVVVDAIMKDLPGIDENKAYEAVFQSSIISHPNSPFDILEKYG
ncbi:MAG: GH92 family glycosyl hydrolase, partial [Muribaculaceae bacterium]